MPKQQEIQRKGRSGDKDRWVINLSDRVLSLVELNLLQRGLNFAITPKKIHVDPLIVATEKACSYLGLKSVKANELRNKVVNCLKNAKPPPSNISEEERKALQELEENEFIKTLPSDKGRATVILNSEDYHKKALDLLNDQTTYTKLKKDPTTKFKKQLVSILQQFEQDLLITSTQKKQLYPTGEEPPKFNHQDYL